MFIDSLTIGSMSVEGEREGREGGRERGRERGREGREGGKTTHTRREGRSMRRKRTHALLRVLLQCWEKLVGSPPWRGSWRDWPTG